AISKLDLRDSVREPYDLAIIGDSENHSQRFDSSLCQRLARRRHPIKVIHIFAPERKCLIDRHLEEHHGGPVTDLPHSIVRTEDWVLMLVGQVRRYFFDKDVKRLLDELFPDPPDMIDERPRSATDRLCE